MPRRTQKAGSFVPHAKPLGRALSLEGARQVTTLLRSPRPEARAEGYASEGGPNPYPPDSPEAVSWDAGARDAHQEHS